MHSFVEDISPFKIGSWEECEARENCSDKKFYINHKVAVLPCAESMFGGHIYSFRLLFEGSEIYWVKNIWVVVISKWDFSDNMNLLSPIQLTYSKVWISLVACKLTVGRISLQWQNGEFAFWITEGITRQWIFLVWIGIWMFCWSLFSVLTLLLKKTVATFSWKRHTTITATLLKMWQDKRTVGGCA